MSSYLHNVIKLLKPSFFFCTQIWPGLWQHFFPKKIFSKIEVYVVVHFLQVTLQEQPIIEWLFNSRHPVSNVFIAYFLLLNFLTHVMPSVSCVECQKNICYKNVGTKTLMLNFGHQNFAFQFWAFRFLFRPWPGWFWNKNHEASAAVNLFDR